MYVVRRCAHGPGGRTAPRDDRSILSHGQALVSAPSPVDGRVLVAVVTYQRNADLEVLLPLLQAEARTVTPAADVLVVDNDPGAGAAGVVARLGADYRHEPVPGIAAARNRALDDVGEHRFIVFIDDDEHPEPGWLRALLETIASTGAAAVAGAVVSQFEHDPDDWVAAGRFFQRRRLATGTPISVAATNNIVFDVEQIAGLRFDLRLGLIGGSDSLFTRLLARDGKVMVWCDEAVVVDRVPASRLTREWVLRRAYRLGNSAVGVSLLMARSMRERATMRALGAGQGLIRIVGGLLRYLYGWIVRSLAHRARGARTTSRGRGMLAAAVGITYAEYQRDRPDRRGPLQRLRP